MKEDKKKILTAAAFLIAAGLVFGMTRSRSGIQKLDESGAVVMSGSLDADGNISWEKNGSAKSDGLPQGDSGSSTEKQELQEPFRDENGSVQGESTVETQEYVENSEKSGVYVYICGEVAAPGVYELSEDSRIYEAVDAAGGFTENAAGIPRSFRKVGKDKGPSCPRSRYSCTGRACFPSNFRTGDRSCNSPHRTLR